MGEGQRRRANDHKLYPWGAVATAVADTHWQFLLGLFDYGYLLRRGALGVHFRITLPIPHLQCNNSYPRERFAPLFHLTD